MWPPVSFNTTIPQFNSSPKIIDHVKHFKLPDELYMFWNCTWHHPPWTSIITKPKLVTSPNVNSAIHMAAIGNS